MCYLLLSLKIVIGSDTRAPGHFPYVQPWPWVAICRYYLRHPNRQGREVQNFLVRNCRPIFPFRIHQGNHWYIFPAMSHREGNPLALCYVRVSTAEQVDEGLSLDAQAHSLTVAATAAGFDVEIIREEGRSAKNIAGRPELVTALDRLAKGNAQALYVHRLDRLSRSVADFAQLLDTARRQGWTINALDIGVDSATPAGELMANVMASMSQYERRIIGVRTREAMAELRRQGVRLGRPTTLPATVLAQIDDLRATGETLAAIAATMNTEQVPTAQGGARWYPATIAKVLKRQQLVAA